MTGLVLTSSEATGSWSPSLWLLSRDTFSHWIWARVQTTRSTAYFNGWPYIILIFYDITIYVCEPHFYNLSALVGCLSSVSIRSIIYKYLNACPFDYTAVVVSGKVERSNTGLTTPVRWLLLLQLTVRFVIKVFGGVFYVVALFFWIFLWVWGLLS